ncbi:hypothetical protein EES37_36725 [Streptomyces sp. ADI91-18]|uniref:hypothetical protein n=1 Tax=Streptomyces sp. ADI91-18 TaxID=1522755 RepID=UPI000FACD32A|nr:hypothetical protein [Streptomyces sp. ADI91-18]RPK27523.1 hypothetical protein EES37_36725 [Streptomyces sp. ADI91-18]
MPRPSRIGRPSPLSVFGAVLTVAGAAMYALPEYSSALLALCAFAVAAVAAER